MFGRSLMPWVLAVILAAFAGGCSGGDASEDPGVAAVERFIDAVYAGDIDGAMGLLDPSQADEGGRRLWEFFSTLGTYGVKVDFTDCAAEGGAVTCRGVHEDAVSEALGMPDGTYHFSYDGDAVTWQPPDPVTLASGETDSPQQFLKGIYHDYLESHYPEDFEAVCSPDGYDPSRILAIRGLAMTPECAAVIGPLDDEIGDWIRAGRPAP